MEELLTVGEAAKLRGVSRSTVYTAVAGGRLPHVRVLQRIGLRKADVLAWEPITYAGRLGVKGRGGRPPGTPMSQEAKARISATQKARWARRKEA